MFFKNDINYNLLYFSAYYFKNISFYYKNRINNKIFENQSAKI